MEDDQNHHQNYDDDELKIEENQHDITEQNMLS